VFIGAGAGLVVKYVLEKMLISSFRAANTFHDLHTFIFHTAVGTVTTLVFWGFEFGFNSAFPDNNRRCLGALIGLAIGYRAKYRLNKHFVFRPRAAP
jgi:putative flippase GtrA